MKRLESDEFDPGTGYERAIAYCAESILRMHVGERLINKVFGRNLQSHAAGLALVMHCEAGLGLGPRPTLSAIQQEIGSARTLAAFFGLLRLAGFIRIERDPADARRHHLVPTDQLFDGLRQWLLHHVRCCEILGLVPERTAERLRADDPAFRRFVGHSRALLTRTRAAMAGDGAWAWIDRFDCGDRIGLMLLHAHGRAAAAGTGERWFPFGSRDVAAKLGISRSHVRNVVNRAEAAGLLRQDRAKHAVALSPRFLAEARGWFLTFWGWVAEAAREIDRPGAAPAPGADAA